MDPPFEKEMSRSHFQSLTEKKPDITREYTITDLLHKIDPSASLDPQAEELILDAADDFIDSIVNLAAECAKGRGSATLQADDINFVISQKFGDSSICGKQNVERQPDFIPNEAYLRRLRAVQEQKRIASSAHIESKKPQ